MVPEPTLRYPTLRRTRTALRWLAPIASTTALVSGISMFAGVAPRLLSVGYGPSERLIWALIGLGYLIGAPIVAFIFFFLLRAAADLIDLWIDNQVASEKTADLLERQLVPGILRICQVLERAHESNATQVRGVAAASSAAPEARKAASEPVRADNRDPARPKPPAVGGELPDAAESKASAPQAESSRAKKIQSMREQLDAAERTGDCEGLLNARDRLSAYLEGTELYQVDRRVAHWAARFLRDALAAGRAKEVIHLAERVTDALGDSTQEGNQIRASLPALRRSAGLCPDCGAPYDASRSHCTSCESKRSAKKSLS